MLLREAVDEGLSSLGNSAKQAIYFYLEQDFSLSKKEISNCPNDFAGAIEKIFGLGAKPLEFVMLNQLYQKVGQRLKLDVSTDVNFAECVAVVKQRYFL